MITSEEIKRRLWNGANELRGSMDASRYKDYMLGLMFYKFLSDKTLDALRRLAQYKMTEQQLLEQYFKDYADLGDVLTDTIQSNLGYCIEPQYLYQTWLRDINSGNFEVQKVTDSFNNFEHSISMTGDADEFKGLFANSTLNLADTALGSNLNERSKSIKALILLFADLNMVELQGGDILGDAYEYLIGQFAMESGKKAGEFYTPRQVSEVMAQIVAKSGKIESIYDPAVGSASLLLTVGRHLDKDARNNLNYYGQEKNTATFNLTRMNLLLHSVRPQKMTIRNGDTLAEDWPEDPDRPSEGVLFDAVVMNPPYSLKNWNRSGITVSDARFESVGVLPPDSKGDYAFLLHGLYHLAPNGTMAIVLPHGVLFRGGSEGLIRQRLLEKNQIDTIIGMPANMFTNTGIPVVVIVLKKNRPLDEPLLVIDASRAFVKEGKQNALQAKDIAKIVDTYMGRVEEEGYSHLATREEIIENEYNLNIPRYVNYANEEIVHDVEAHLQGGIPKSNFMELKVMVNVVPDILESALELIRPGYYELKKPIETLRQEVFAHPQFIAKSQELEQKITAYLDKYWPRLNSVNAHAEVAELMEQMLLEIKDLLSQFKFIDVYDGYQIIAETWQASISHDLELISRLGFYEAARQLEPNMVTKGSGSSKRQEQAGWVGSMIPNELIETSFYQEESAKIQQQQQRIAEIEAELSELVEAAKVEDSEENNALFAALKKNADDEPGDSFETRAVKAELKAAEKGTEAYRLLELVDNLIKEKSQVARDISQAEKNLDKIVEARIPELTELEIDGLMQEKWFGKTVEKMVNLLQEPLNKDINTLALLNDRYKDNIEDIDAQITVLEREIAVMMAQMVVTYE